MIAYFTPEKLIAKLVLRLKSPNEKQYEIHGHKWEYMLKTLQKLKDDNDKRKTN
jgi:hypothetical protein